MKQGDRVQVVRDTQAERFATPSTVGLTGTVLEVGRVRFIDRAKVELDFRGIPAWFHVDELEVTP